MPQKPILIQSEDPLEGACTQWLLPGSCLGEPPHSSVPYWVNTGTSVCTKPTLWAHNLLSGGGISLLAGSRGTGWQLQPFCQQPQLRQPLTWENDAGPVARPSCRSIPCPLHSPILGIKALLRGDECHLGSLTLGDYVLQQCGSNHSTPPVGYR